MWLPSGASCPQYSRQPPAPHNPSSYPESDERRWYEYEYAGWGAAKLPQPRSRGDGPAGKRIACVLAGEHAYYDAFRRGMEKVAWAFGIETSFSHSSFEPSIAYRAGLPTIYANTIPDPECFRYCLAWTGPDDWAQTRAIARRFAERLGGKGGYAIVQHVPGSSAFYSRTYALVTELAKVAPEMRLLEAAHSRFDRADTAELVGKGVLDSITYPPRGRRRARDKGRRGLVQRSRALADDLLALRHRDEGQPRLVPSGPMVDRPVGSPRSQ